MGKSIGKGRKVGDQSLDVLYAMFSLVCLWDYSCTTISSTVGGHFQRFSTLITLSSIGLYGGITIVMYRIIKSLFIVMYTNFRGKTSSLFCNASIQKKLIYLELPIALSKPRENQQVFQCLILTTFCYKNQNKY